MRDIIVKYKLGYSQGTEIIEWATESFGEKSILDNDVLETLMCLDKNDGWERDKAEKIFFDNYSVSNQDLLHLTKSYLYDFLQGILSNKNRLYDLVSLIGKIKTTSINQDWLNELNKYCVYLMPDSTLSLDSKLAIEINSILTRLSKELQKEK